MSAETKVYGIQGNFWILYPVLKITSFYVHQTCDFTKNTTCDFQRHWLDRQKKNYCKMTSLRIYRNSQACLKEAPNSRASLLAGERSAALFNLVCDGIPTKLKINEHFFIFSSSEAFLKANHWSSCAYFLMITCPLKCLQTDPKTCTFPAKITASKSAQGTWQPCLWKAKM